MKIKTKIFALIAMMSVMPFVAQAQEPDVDTSDIVPPTVVSAIANFDNEVEVLFNEPITLPEDAPEQYFSIEEEFDSTVVLEVVEVEQDEDNPSLIILTTETQAADTHYVLTVSSTVTDLALNPIVSGVTDTASFIGTALSQDEPSEPEEPTQPEEIPEETTEPVVEPEVIPEEIPEPIVEPDTTAPEEVRNLVAQIKEQVGQIMKHYIELSWLPSLNIAGDLADQKVYTSLDNGTKYDAGVSVGSKATSYQKNNLTEGQNYVFKVTSLDTEGNESTGAVTSIRYLPQTGMGAGIALLGISAAAGAFVRRRKQ